MRNAVEEKNLKKLTFLAFEEIVQILNSHAHFLNYIVLFFSIL